MAVEKLWASRALEIIEELDLLREFDRRLSQGARAAMNSTRRWRVSRAIGLA